MRTPDFHQVALFVLASKPQIFGVWPFARLKDWLRYHWEQRALAVVTEGDEVVGMAVAWRAQMPDIDWPWTKWDDRGKALYIAQLHAAKPMALMTLLRALAVRCPDCFWLPMFATRRGKRVRLPRRYVQRLWNRTIRQLNPHPHHGR